MGRERETRTLRALVDAAASGRGGALLLTGEAGVGKSRLAEVAAGLASRAGVRTRAGRATQLEIGRPLAAAFDALGGSPVPAPASGDPAARTVLEVGAGSPAAFLATERLLGYLEDLCHEGPLLLVVEDLHWADTSTLGWLRLVLARLHALPLALLLSTRPAQSGTDVHRFLFAAKGLTELTVEPLSCAAVTELSSLVLDRAVGPALSDALTSTRGNPLLVLALLDALGAAGALDDVDGTVDLAVSSPTIHAGSAIAAGVGEIDVEVLRVIQVAATLGSTVAVSDLAAVLGRPSLDVVPALEAAALAGVLVPAGDGYAFRHDLYRDAVTASISTPARAALHLDAARALAATGASPLVVAEHFAQGARRGNREAVTWLQRAAVEVVSLAPGTALRLLDVALALCATSPPFDLLVVRVQALAGAGHTAEAEALVRSLLREGLEPSTEARLRRELALVYFTQGRAAECVREMELVGGLTDDAHRGRVQAEIAFARFVGLDHAGARPSARAAVAEGQRTGDVATHVAGCSVLCWLELFANRFGSALALTEEVVRLVRQPNAGEAHVYQPWFAVGLARIEIDDHAGVAEAVGEGRAGAERAGATWAIPGYEALSSFVALRSGALDHTVAAANAALAYVDGCDGFGVAVWCHAFLAQVALHLGDDGDAAGHIATAEQWLVSTRAQFGWEQVMVAKARLHERRGQKSEALAALTVVWDLFGDIGVLSGRQQIGSDLVRLACEGGDLGRATSVTEALGVAAETSGSTCFRAQAELGASWLHNDADRALHAVALARQTPRRPMTAAALADAGWLLRGAGRNAEADARFTEAAALYAELGAFADADALASLVHTTRRRAPRPRFGFDALTSTELRVVRLVAEGLSNVEIANQLYVSRRTVESHVSSAYRKLEVSSRFELGRLVMTHQR